MNCPKCGEQNSDDSKFCRNCGETLKSTTTQQQDNKKKIIIVCLIVVVIILACAVLYASGIFKNEVPLRTENFEVFKMDVPVGSYFEEFTSIPAFQNIGGLVYLKNIGNYSEEVTVFGVSKMGASIPSQMKFEREDRDVRIFKDKDDTGLYMVAINKDDFFFNLMGKDVDTMVKMIKSIEITNPNGLESKNASSATPSTASTPTSSTPSSMNIIGGSFSTGSGDGDKTYASINVGKQHAGENVIVQIRYSRDGNTLNNGNMVPATVHSDGYLEISSADAYKYYPDHATINIYDSNSKLLTTTDVTLSPTSGTQTF